MQSDVRSNGNKWALVLGASSGFGGACAIELARNGFNIFGVHLDRAATMPNVEQITNKVKGQGRQAVFYNMNAADASKRAETLTDIEKRFAKEAGHIRVLIHSLAFGTLRPFVAAKLEEAITQAQLEMTCDVMAHSLVYWTQGLIVRKLMRRGGRIFALTSSGGHAQIPSYGAVSAAKAALESHCRQLAMELGPRGITANAIMAGVTDTPALRKIPDNMEMLSIARNKNPGCRLTMPEDVAKAIALLANEDAFWISGNVIGVDGGEDIVSYVGQKTELEND